MLKKSLTLITLLCAMVPMVAHAASWSLATRVNTVGGTISSRNNAAQNSANGTVFKSYTTHANLPVTITAATGYKISSVSVNGLNQVIPLAANPVQMGLTAYPTKTSQAVVASFVKDAATRVNITTAAGAGGSVSPVPGTYAVTQGSTAYVTFLPSTGNYVTAVTSSVGATILDAATNAAPVFPYAGSLKVKFTASAAQTITGTFSAPIVANAGADQTVAINTAVTLTGANAGYGTATTYAWSQSDGPVAVTLAGNPAIFTPTVAGKYVFKLTVSNATDFATDTVVVNATNPNATFNARTQCIDCHNAAGVGGGYAADGVYANWSTGGHNNSFHPAKCINCHVNADTGNHPGTLTSSICSSCHTGPYTPTTVDPNHTADTDCIKCHKGGSAHKAEASCVACHASGLNAGSGFVQDNDGVRAITGEFSKWSHHVTGVTLNDAHCAACHLEGKVDAGKVVVDTTVHMSDARTHLRNADTDADMAWDPAAPNFTTMDNFCMSCHDALGATSAGSQAIQAFINTNGIAAAGKTASATNPFGDTISNQYDMLERPAVVDAAGQFAIGNPSHHAVVGKRYAGRSRVSKGGTIDDAVFTANSSATLPGARSTIFDAGKFEATYITLANAGGETGARNGGTTLGDDSTLHCGDCHTVGQYRAADVGTRFNKAVIGAHGSNNEYMLRNNAGTDVKHTGVKFAGTAGFGAALGYNTTTKQLDGSQAYLVCFNCHAFTTYGSTFGASGSGHANEYMNQDRCNGPYNTTFKNMTGEARLESVKTNNNGTLPVVSNTFGNVFGIQCNNCHNSGIAGNMFGGIHGSKAQTYTDGMGNTSKHMRFLPGLGNTMFVPGVKGGITGGSLAAYNVYSGNRNGTGTGKTSGQTFTTLPVRTIINNVTVKTGSYQYVTGGVSSDLNWEQKTQQSIAGEVDLQSKSMGCYTLTPPGTVKVVGQNGDANKLAATDGQLGPDGREMFDVWGGCDDHNGAQGAGTSIVRKVLRPVSY